LVELSSRNSKEMIELSINILKNELGDKYFQGLTFSVLYGKDENKALSIISEKICDLNVVVLKNVMNELVTDFYQPIAQKIDNKLLYNIKKRYLSLSNDDKSYFDDEYDEFVNFYGNRIP
jgi:hypothetical protein